MANITIQELGPTDINTTHSVTMVSFAGDLDQVSIEQDSEKVEELINSIPNESFMLFDFSNLMYINSRSISHLVNWFMTLEKKSSKLILFSLRPNIIDILDTTGITNIIPIYSNMLEIKAAIEQNQIALGETDTPLETTDPSAPPNIATTTATPEPVEMEPSNATSIPPTRITFGEPTAPENPPTPVVAETPVAATPPAAPAAPAVPEVSVSAPPVDQAVAMPAATPTPVQAPTEPQVAQLPISPPPTPTPIQSVPEAAIPSTVAPVTPDVTQPSAAPVSQPPIAETPATPIEAPITQTDVTESPAPAQTTASPSSAAQSGSLSITRDIPQNTATEEAPNNESSIDAIASATNVSFSIDRFGAPPKAPEAVAPPANEAIAQPVEQTTTQEQATTSPTSIPASTEEGELEKEMDDLPEEKPESTPISAGSTHSPFHILQD